MFAVSHFLSGEKSIFKSQVNYKIDSPVHYDEFKFFILKQHKVEDVMTKNVIAVEKKVSVIEAGQLLREFNISALPVIEDDRVIGIVTDSDLIKACTREVETLKVADIMNENPVCVTPDKTLFDTLSTLIENNVEVAPVVNSLKERKLIGIISDFDIGKVLTRTTKF